MRVSHRLAVAAGVLCRRRFVPGWLKLSLVLLSALGTGRAALALSGSNTWYSGAGSGSWQTTSNWGSGTFNFVVPGATSGTTNTDTATFDTGSSTTSIVPDANRNLGNISFGNSAAAYTIGTTSGNALLMTSGGTIQIASTFSGSNITERVNAPLILEGDYSFANNSTNAGVSLNFGGSVTSTLPPATITHLAVSGAGSMTIGGSIGNGGGTVELIMSGTGTLTLSGNNTLTGGVWIYSGNVIVTNSGAFNSTNPDYLTLINGTLTLNGHSVTLGGLSNRGYAGNPVIQNASATPATLTVVAPANEDFDGTDLGVLQDGPGGGALTLIKAGPGPMTLSGTNTFTGGLMVQNGTLAISSVNNANTAGPLGKLARVTLGSTGNTGAILLPGGGAVSSNMPFTLAAGGSGEFDTLGTATLTGVISGSGGLVVGGDGGLTLTAGNTFTGGLTVQNGILSVGVINNANTNGPLGNNGNVTLASAAAATSFIDYTGASASSNMPFNVQSNSGGRCVIGVIASTTNLTLTGAIAGSGRLTSAGSGTLTLANTVSVSGGIGVGNFDTGTLILAGNNAFSGGVLFDGGTLLLANAGALNSSAPNAVAFDNGASGLLNLNGYSITIGGLDTPAKFGTAIVQNANATPVTLTVSLAGNSTYAGTLQDGPGGGALALIKAGPGMLTLGHVGATSGANTFSGGLTLSAGQLNINYGGSSSSNSAIGTGLFTVDGGTIGDTSGSAVALATNNPQQWNGDFAFAGPGDLNLGTGNVTLGASRQVTVNAGNVTVGGPISGMGFSLTKAGPGILTFAGNNTYSGGTSVVGGTLRTIGGGTLGAGSLIITAANGITSAVNLAGSNQDVSSISGTIAGSGTATFSVAAGVTLTDNQSSGNTSYQGALANSGIFAKSGISTLELNTAPTLNAGSSVFVNGGKLRFNFVTGVATIGTGVTATVNSAAVLELAGPISALSSSNNRVNVVNNSTGPGLLVSGSHQQVGNIDGAGTTQVNAGSDLTANHIVQSALVIGGTSGSPALVTIDASDASGNPLGQASGFALAGSLTPNAPFGSAGINSANLNAGSGSLANGSTLGGGTPGGTLNSSAAAVPEPATLLLALLGLAAIGCLPRDK
jgi:fibronectin-binding autotransporter adhesin